MRAKSEVFDCIVVGGGPGGLISALYLRRFKRSIALIHSGTSRAAWGPKINNLIGYNEGISGRTLLARVNRQLNQIGGLQRIEGEAKVKRSGREYEVQVGSAILRAKKVILATGIHDVHPEVPNLTDLRKRGLLKYCSICDGYENSDKPIAVLAKDDFGIEKALFIGNWTKKISIIIPKKQKLSAQYLREIKAISAKVIRCETLSMTPRKNSGLEIRIDNQDTIRVAVAYVELGCVVNDSAYKAMRGLKRSKEGFINTDTEQRTSVPGLFAVGDCVNLLGQISVAAGQAAVAATTIHNDLLT